MTTETKGQRKVRIARELRQKRRAEAAGAPVPLVAVKAPAKKKPAPALKEAASADAKARGIVPAKKAAATAKKAAPADAPMVVISFRDSQAMKDKFDKLGASAWGRKVLRAAKL